MDFHIKKVVLWPRGGGLERREISFEKDNVNVVTGWSHTGKSSLLSIVDYCLGSGKCMVPVGKVRDTTAWYGVVAESRGVEMVIARHKPGDTGRSTKYYVDTGSDIDLPEMPRKNSTWVTFKSRMDELCGLSPLDFAPEKENAGFQSRASFRDMAAFNFQPQHIIANPHTLFYKTDTTVHREKLRTVFPVVLGAVDNSYLFDRHRLEKIQKELTRSEKEVERKRNSIEEWKGEISNYHSRALELGLLPSVSETPDETSECVANLRRIAERADEGDLSEVQVGATERAVSELEDVREKERALDRELSELRRKLERIESLGDSVEQYEDALSQHAARLEGTEWFEDFMGDHSECPVCGASSIEATEQIEEIIEAADAVRSESETWSETPDHLDELRVKITAKLEEKERELRKVRKRRWRLENEDETAGQRLDQVLRFIGQIERAIESVDETAPDSDLMEKLERLKSRKEKVEKRLASHERKKRENAALKKISRLIGDYAEKLDLERHNDIISLDIKELTLRFSEVENPREDYLWEIGSGANWMGYHLSTMLALHEFMIKERNERTPVPSFLFLDQPSQVYFPPGSLDRQRSIDRDRRRDDFESTRDIFRLLSSSLERLQSKLQIVVVEHATNEVWEGIDNVKKVENWRGDEKDFLIPETWIEWAQQTDFDDER